MIYLLLPNSAYFGEHERRRLNFHISIWGERSLYILKHNFMTTKYYIFPKPNTSTKDFCGRPKNFPGKCRSTSSQSVKAPLVERYLSAKHLLIHATDAEQGKTYTKIIPRNMFNVISGPIKFLTRLLRKAVDTTYHRYLGFAARQLALGLTRVAVNDNNKKTVMLLFTSTSF